MLISSNFWQKLQTFSVKEWILKIIFENFYDEPKKFINLSKLYLLPKIYKTFFHVVVWHVIPYHLLINTFWGGVAKCSQGDFEKVLNSFAFWPMLSFLPITCQAKVENIKNKQILITCFRISWWLEQYSLETFLTVLGSLTSRSEWYAFS